MIWGVATASAATIVVAQDGTGDATTISDALWMARAGDTVLVRAGTYGPSTGEDLPFVFNDGVSLEGASRETVTIDAEGENFGTIAGTTSIASIRLTGGAPFRDADNGAAILVVTSGRLVLTDITLDDHHHRAVYSEGWVDLSDVELRDNRSDDGSGAVGLFATCGVASRVRALDEGPGAGFHLGGGRGPTDPCIWGEVDASFIRGQAVGATSLTNSVIAGSSKTAAPTTGCAYADNASNNLVIGCPEAWALVADSAANNLVAHNAGAGIVSRLAVGNLTWGNDAGNWAFYDHTGTRFNIAADPRFRDFSDDGNWTNDEFRLADDSPAIDAASSDFPPFDLDGVPRPQDGDGDGVPRADIGPFEWGRLDHDHDGWFVEDDCNDDDAAINPAARDLPYNGVDEDCDGHDLIDADGDGFDADHQGGDDCDDTEATINPGAWDVPEDGVDQDCDGVDPRDDDDDGWPAGLDCDDNDPTIFPTQTEWCDGIDQDCDDRIDDDCVAEERIGGCCSRGDDASLWVLAPLLWLAGRRRRR